MAIVIIGDKARIVNTEDPNLSGIIKYLLSNSQKIKKIKESNKLANKILDNLEETRSIEDIRRYNSQQRAYENNFLNPIKSQESTDHVYNKLGRAEKYARFTQFSSLYKINELKLKIERREMGEEEYSHLNKTEIQDLFKEWEEFNKDSLEKKAVSV